MDSLPADLFDTTTLLSLGFTVLIVLAGYGLSKLVLPADRQTTAATRFLFIWHATDALCHVIMEGSFLYLCFFSWVPRSSLTPEQAASWYPTPYNFLGHGDTRVYGAQTGGENPFAQMWMVYARADKRWAGVDLGVVSLEILTVVFDTALALLVCWGLARRDPKTNIWMIILATAELYGGFMTFCPEWLVGNLNLDTSNFMYKWVYLVFFNTIWVWIPLWTIWYAVGNITEAFSAKATLEAEGAKAKKQ